MATKQPPIAVIGAGVIGLTSAVTLLEAGHAVTIFARETPPNTTSDVAAAYWAAHEYGSDQRRAWALHSHSEFLKLAANPASGVDLLDIYELAEEPFSLDYNYDYGVKVEGVEEGHFAAPWQSMRFHVPRIDVPVYMPWLFQHFLALGGSVNLTTVTDLAEFAGLFSTIVNCSGLGAGELIGDRLFPIRGQVMRVRQFAGLHPAIISAHNAAGVAYIIPRRNDVLLGGTFQYYDENRQVDAAISEGILQRCAQFYPQLRQAEILEQRVGLRPGRHAVRLEVERYGDGTLLIHNYGHGAYGHTLSWGCAAEVAKIVQENQ